MNISKLFNSVDPTFNFITKDNEGRVVLFSTKPKFNKKGGYYHTIEPVDKAGIVPIWLNIEWDNDSTIIKRPDEHAIPIKSTELLKHVKNDFVYMAKDKSISLFTEEPIFNDDYGFYFLRGISFGKTAVIPDWLLIEWDGDTDIIKRGG